MYYKTLSDRLTRCGWEITDEGHGGNIYPHYFRYDHPNDQSRTNEYTIEMVTASNKDGTPGKILKLWQGGKPCRV